MNWSAGSCRLAPSCPGVAPGAKSITRASCSARRSSSSLSTMCGSRRANRARRSGSHGREPAVQATRGGARPAAARRAARRVGRALRASSHRWKNPAGARLPGLDQPASKEPRRAAARPPPPLGDMGDEQPVLGADRGHVEEPALCGEPLGIRDASDHHNGSSASPHPEQRDRLRLGTASAGPRASVRRHGAVDPACVGGMRETQGCRSRLGVSDEAGDVADAGEGLVVERPVIHAVSDE